MNYCTQIPVASLGPVERIIVVGDVHGDWRALKSALSAAGLLNVHNEWTGGQTHLVQVGDLIDRQARGAGGGDEQSERKILRHLMDLGRKARAVGGDVHLLLGNHELMNVSGDFRYVSPLGMKDFGGQREKLFRPGGKIAKFMACNMNSVLKIGSWVFSHAGVTAKITQSYSVDQVNKYIRDFLLGNTTIGDDDPMLDIFWHRGYATEQSCPLVRDSLQHWQAKNMAIGHTVQDEGINSLCSGNLWKVDVGMSSAFGYDRPIEVLEILNDGDTVNILRGRSPVGK